TTGGRGWSNRSLGKDQNQQGEYLIRLRLGRYPEHGTALTPVLDLWRADRSGLMATPAKLLLFQNLDALTRYQPEGTRLVTSLRTGRTPQPEAKTWTDWVALDKDYQPPESAARHRWAQLRFEFVTNHPQTTPRLPRGFTVGFRVEDQADTRSTPYQ